MLQTVTTTQQTLAKLHAMLGTAPASWETYRAEMVTTYGLNGDVLDALFRLGYLQATNAGISFHA